MNHYQDLITRAIDLHVHVGPEIIPRRFTVASLQRYEEGKIAMIGVKNHFFPTIAMSGDALSTGPSIIYSVVLNNYLGGLNAKIIRASAELSKNPLIVWFPTIHSCCGLAGQEFEIPKEWIDPGQLTHLKLQPTKNIIPLSILDTQGNFLPETLEVLLTIKEYDCILASGHLPWQETILLVERAVEMGITRIILTHPIYQKIQMPLLVQQRLAAQGARIEVCFSMYAIDGIPMKDLAEQIRIVGAEHCILSSDVGQQFSKSPSEALVGFCELLSQEGVTDEELEKMLIINPKQLVRPLFESSKG